MNYPFDFREMLLTDRALDTLGFTEYWAGCGDFGDRKLELGGKQGDPRLVEKKESPKYIVMIMDEKEDVESGYGTIAEYNVGHLCNKDFEPLYFLHDMYEDILKRRTPEEVQAFVALTKKKGVNMYPYLQSYLEWKIIHSPVAGNKTPPSYLLSYRKWEDQQKDKQ